MRTKELQERVEKEITQICQLAPKAAGFFFYSYFDAFSEDDDEMNEEKCAAKGKEIYVKNCVEYAKPRYLCFAVNDIAADTIDILHSFAQEYETGEEGNLE